MANGQIGSSYKRLKRKVCAACGVNFGNPLRDGEIPSKDACKKCRKILRAGGAIFITTSGKFLSIVPKEGVASSINPKLAGGIWSVTEEQIKKIAADTGQELT